MSLAKRIVFYYHHFGGYGHGMRIFSICKALQLTGKFEILVINSGARQPEIGLDRYAKVLNLPPVVAAQSLFTGLDSRGDIHVTLAQRQVILKKIAEKFHPEITIIEHFPFGRMSLEQEILGFIHELKKKDCKVYASVRDLILSAGKEEYFRQFNAIFIHEDQNFERSSQVPSNGMFTGRVHPYDAITSIEKNNRIESLGLGSRKLIVASIGGGLDGHALLAKLIRVKPKIDAQYPCLLMIFTGAAFPEGEREQLEKDLPPDCRLITFDSDLMEYVHAADLFISMGGYNSVNSHLLTDTPSMIFPRLSDKEQWIRAQRYGFKCYHYDDISRDGLVAAIYEKLAVQSEAKKIVDLSGAQTTARFIAKVLDLKRAKIRVKTRCNLACSMCNWKDMEEQLEEERICAVLDDLALLSVPVVNFTGGEPTTFPGLERVMRYAKTKGFRISLSTNGFNLRALEKIVPFLDYVDISLDSTVEDLNDAIRGRKGAYAAALKAIHYLCAAGIKPHINVTVRPDNYKNVRSLIALLFAQISSISFTLVDTAVNQMEELKFSYEQLEEYYVHEVVEIFQDSVKYAMPVRIKPFFDDLQELDSRSVLARISHSQEQYFGRLQDIFTLKGRPCQIAKDQVRINANGNIRPCCYLDDEQIHFGNIHRRPLKNLITDDAYFNHVVQAKEGIGACSVCQQGYVGYKELCLSKA